MGIDIEESHFYTSALATAHFLKNQAPDCSAYVIGAHGLLNALYDAGITFNDVNPDYVVVGETTGYNYEMILKATELIHKGAKLIATNSDLTGPSERGIIPACRALVSPIEMATGKQAYFIGKPNPLMMRTGLKKLGVHSEDSVMIGDRMDTDIVAGVETGLETVLVLTGVSTRENIKKFSYQPHYILNGIGDLVPGYKRYAPRAERSQRKEINHNKKSEEARAFSDFCFSTRFWAIKNRPAYQKHAVIIKIMAEWVGFEPTRGLTPLTI